MPLNFVALLRPKPSRVQVARVEEIVHKVREDVHEKEPGVLRYQWFRAGSTEKPLSVVWETSTMDWLAETDEKENNMAVPIEVLPLEQFAGWESRS
ncbi:hypothetical protein C8A00DRAFT_43472 [Chaetomidium leptoderma]|uniref:ABM domain-containing protein n=1 Tax=Chaetomidium leptoderma TaxID=669021 RepID=A0AAN6ZX85_9PEZI|nr:hypothetical protein C8A00DRAFT_43472 [Chaetomidium leptoderma]